MQISLTRTQFTAASARLQQQLGAPVSGDDGVLNRDGVSVEYHYDGAVLNLTVLKKPFYATTAMVENQIRAWLHN